MSADIDNEENADLSNASTALVEDDVVSSDVDSNEETDKTDVPSKEKKRKPFLGGYRNKWTGLIYHHVATQTVKSPWNYGGHLLFHRDAQTVETKDVLQQTARHACTQVEVRNIFMQSSKDRVSTASDTIYIPADELQRIYIAKVISVQRYVRRWLAIRELKRRQQALLEKLEWERQQKRFREKQDTDWLRDVQRRKLYPIKEDDFLLLFSDLQNWWENEVEEISTTKSGQDQQFALCQLVNEEAVKISDINKVKTDVENRKVNYQRFKNLIEAGKPKLWKAYKDDIHVITPASYKGKNLQDLYVTLSMKCIATQDRLDALQSLIQLLQPYNTSLTNTLLRLTQREIDLLLRGTKAQNLQGLRSRIQDLFWQCVKQPMFNPQMRNQPHLKKVDGKNPFILCCAGCKQFYALPADTGSEVIGKSVIGNCFVKCKKCLYLENEGWIRKDTELYKKILKLLITEEERKPSASSIIYILQPNDIKHLVEAIWKRQSCLSGDTVENELELVRYNVEDNWTPWNCMLVTREEAAILSGIPNPKESYDDQFKKFVYQRHVAARTHFATIPRFLPYVTASVINKDYDSSSESEDN